MDGHVDQTEIIFIKHHRNKFMDPFHNIEKIEIFRFDELCLLGQILLFVCLG